MSDESRDDAPEEQEQQDTVKLSRSEVEKLRQAAQKLDEFRENNRELYRQVEQYKGIDPDEARKQREELQKLRNQLEAKDAGVDDEELEELLQKRYGQAIEKEKTRAEELEQKYKTTAERLTEVLLDNEVTMAAKGLEDFVGHAIPDAIRLVRDQFKVENGVAVHREGAMDEDGKPMTPAKLLSLTKKSNSGVFRPHWWKANVSGGGATGNQGDTSGKEAKTREEFDRLNVDQKMEFMKRVNQGKAELVSAA